MTTATVTWEQKEVRVAMGSRRHQEDLYEALNEGWEPYAVMSTDAFSVTHYLKRSRP